jgi:hypothetical protein
VAALALSVLAAPAGALVRQIAGGQAVGVTPLRGQKAALGGPLSEEVEYDFGPVMASNTNYAFYWDPAGAPAYPKDYRPGINRFFHDLAHDSGGHENIESVSAQYNDTAGNLAAYNSHFGGAILDTDPYPANGCRQAAICLTDAQIRAEIAAYVTAHNLPADLTHEYFFLPPPGVESCFEATGHECSAGTQHAAYCAYHAAFALGEGVLVYANDPYVTGNEGCDDGNHPNGTTSDGAIEGGLTHEQNESITDPLPGLGWTNTLTGEEVGDKCNFVMGKALGVAPDGARYNQVINGDPYWTEEVWSNTGIACKQRLTPAAKQPTAVFTAEPVPGKAHTIRVDGSASVVPGGAAEYAWQFNTRPYNERREFILETTVRGTKPTAVFAFKRAGVYEIGLTVFAADGTSRGTSQAVQVH